MRNGRKFYWAILSNGLPRTECLVRKARSLVPHKNLEIIKDDLGRHRLVRKVYRHEFIGNHKWRISVRKWDHPRVLRWLRRAERRKARKRRRL